MQTMRCSFFLLFFSLVLSAEPILLPGTWHAERNGKALKLTESPEKTFTARTEFPGGFLLYKEQNRCTFKPDETVFSATELTFEVRATNITSPLKAWIFAKDKDGAWFQTDKEYALQPDQWTTLSVRLDVPGKNLLPLGHRSSWSGFYASKIFSAGLSIYSDDMQQADIEWREPVFLGKRKNETPSVLNWNLPETASSYDMIRSRFELDKEYFNPFDPDKIAVDFEVLSPSSSDKIRSYPAFFTQNYLRNIHFTKETFSPEGLPFWEMRYIPLEPGIHKLRLSITDASIDPDVVYTVYTEWRTVNVKPAPAKGFIRVSKKNPAYFEYENGELFYPIGINIHSNTDQRSENSFGFGHLPDRGNVDYEEYIRRCSESGINLMEVWMAAWTYAIEWSSFRPGYYGLGVYHLGHAAKLDGLLDYAKKHNVNISLVLDNHGKIADVYDPEWHDSPFNATTPFAVANSAFLNRPYEFWSNEKAIRYNEKRNRYIAARWGAYTNIFAMQLWSEVDLAGDSYKAKDDKTIIKWHQATANNIKQITQGKYLNSTHVCGDIGNTLNWKALLVDPKEMDHVCSDAYRDTRIPFTNQMIKHYQQILSFTKPALVTEYGGTSNGQEFSYAAGDVHSGIWAALFTRHAGTPWLWWHDFIHINNFYPHFLGFSKFLQGLDPRSGSVTFGEIRVQYTRLTPPVQPTMDFVEKLFTPKKQIFKIPTTNGLSGMFYNQNETFLCGWVYNADALFQYRKNFDQIPFSYNVKATINTKLKAGLYIISFFDTITNAPVSSYFFKQEKTGSVNLRIPDIKLDIAFKAYRIGDLP